MSNSCQIKPIPSSLAFFFWEFFSACKDSSVCLKMNHIANVCFTLGQAAYIWKFIKNGGNEDVIVEAEKHWVEHWKRKNNARNPSGGSSGANTHHGSGGSSGGSTNQHGGQSGEPHNHGSHLYGGGSHGGGGNNQHVPAGSSRFETLFGWYERCHSSWME